MDNELFHVSFLYVGLWFPVLSILDCRISFADPIAVRHSLEIVSELAAMDPYAVAMALGKIVKLENHSPF